MRLLAVLMWFGLAARLPAAEKADDRYPLFSALTGEAPPKLIAYTPSRLDPRNPANQGALKASSIRADLEALRPVFDGLVLYGYHEACTPRILAAAKALKFKAVILAVYDVKSAAEIDGVAALARLFADDFVLGVCCGNEGVTFGRYEADDLASALARLRKLLPKDVPVGTSEPLAGYKHDFIREFGDFLLPNIHPVFDRPNLGPAEAAAWARSEALKLATLTGKPVVLKETGFPHGGKAIFTPATQNDYWRAYVKPGLLTRAENKAWVYYGVGFEAFDLAWKAADSNLAIEASWGLFSAGREPYPAAGVWKKD